MNPFDWEDALRRLQTHLVPNNSGVNNSMENVLRTSNDCDTYCEYSRYTIDDPHNSTGVNVGWEEHSPASHNFYSKDLEVENPDGEPLEIDEEDAELARKRKELRVIEERIIFKRATLALKKVEPFVKNTTPPGLSCNEQSATCEGETLRDRVKLILQKRHSVSFLSKVQSPRERMNTSSLSRGRLLLEDHPLKRRVKAVLQQRHCDPCVLPTNMEVPEDTPHPPCQSVTSLASEESSNNKGFQRFLSVLNKGVDIDLLSRIVNDDSEDLNLGEELLNIQPPAVENKKSELPFRSESQRPNSGASLPGHSRTNSGERKTDPLSRERSPNERLLLPGDEEKKKDRRDDSFSSSSRSKSPPAVKKKKEEEKQMVDEQREQLQNILKTLGLTLEVEEMSKLADRTQERLYGKKHEGKLGADSRGEQVSRQRGSHRHCRSSSSSSSSASSSRSTSRSFSPSPSRQYRSHSRDSKRRRASESSCSRDSRERSRSRDGLTHQDGSQDNKDAQRARDKDKDRKDSQEISTYHHPYSQEQTYSHPHAAAFPAYPDYSLSQCPEYTAYHSGTYSAATNSYWTYTQGAIPPSLDPSGYPYPQNTTLHFPSSVVAPNMMYDNSFEDINLLVNPDLSKSEGQIGSASDHRCLRVITTKQSTTQSCLKQLTKGPKRTAKYRRQCRKWFQKLKERKKQQKMAAKMKREQGVAKVEASQGDEDNSKTEQSGNEKKQLTEEEIKVNLRKKLEAFNQKVKQKVTQPASSLTNSLTSQTG